MESDKDSVVMVGETEPTLKVNSLETPFVDGGEEQRTTYIHKSTIAGLKADTEYGESSNV